MATWNPEDYHQHSSQQQKWARENLARLAPAGHERVLDLGSGDGKVTAEPARAVPRGAVVGLDSSPDMVAFARKTFPPAQFPNLRFEVGDARALHFDAEFDWVVSFATLHWVIDHGPLLAGIRRSLKPGGRILLQFGGKGNAARVVEALARVMARPKWAAHFAGFQFPWGFYEAAEYRRWMVEAGLTPTRVELVPKDMVHQGKEGLLGWLRTTWWPYLKRLPEPRQPEFLDECADEYLKDNPTDPDGRVHLEMVRLEVEGSRV